MTCEKTVEQLQRDEIVRQTLERAARRIEEINGNETYQKAFKVAAQAVRSLKELVNPE